MSLIKYFSLENNVNFGMILFLNINEGLSLKKKKTKINGAVIPITLIIIICLI
jgi:tetrahydromethanopterin S-methyltransferase subunit E